MDFLSRGGGPLCLDSHGADGQLLEPCYLLSVSVHWSSEQRRLTSIDILNGLLRLLASVVLSRRLRRKAGLGASIVKVAAVVHSLLKRVALPAENVVTVGSRSTVICIRNSNEWLF